MLRGLKSRKGRKMTKRQNNGTFKELFAALSETSGIMIGLVGHGLLEGLGFWLAFYLMMK